MWGLDGVLIVALLHHFSSIEIVLFEHLLLMVFSVPVLIWKRTELRRLNVGDWFAVLFIAWGGSAVASVLFTAAFNTGNANVVLLMQKLQPVFAVLLAAIVLKERLTKNFWTVFIAALGGAYLLTFGFHIPTTGMSAHKMTGAVLSAGAAILWGGSTVMGKRLVAKVSFTTVTSLRFVVAIPLLATLTVLSSPHWPEVGFAFTVPPVWINLLFQALVPSLLSLLIYYFGLRGTRASYATLAELAFPAVGLLLNWTILHQSISGGQWLGFAVVWLAVLQLSKTPAKRGATLQLEGVS
ncbi:EamA family transporter [Alicyclobacillus sp. SO9]|nr:EamA family transporter [Alicyclobacillus sp. SO9]